MGTCGPAPDVALMLKEPFNRFDLFADARGWDCAERKFQLWLAARLSRANRFQQLRDQVNESRRTHTAPFGSMTQSEQKWFLAEIKPAK